MYPLIERFITERPDLVESMNTSNHNGKNSVNPYHIEGDVWTHTMMVCNQAQNNNGIAVKLSALLHDIGKPRCRVEEDGKVMYYGHEGMSFYMAIDILKTVFKDIKYDKEIILFIIANHDLMFKWKKSESKKYTLADQLQIFDERTLLSQLLFEQHENDLYGRIGQGDVVESHRALVELRILMQWNLCPPMDVQTMNTLTILVGPPAGGKTTWSKEHHETIISRDELLMEIYSDRSYREAWMTADHKEVDRQLHQKFNQALKDGENIIIDMTNMTKKSRRKWINPARQKGYRIEAKVFATGFEEIKARNAIRTAKIIPEDVIERMCKSFRFPLGDEVDHVEMVWPDDL